MSPSAPTSIPLPTFHESGEACPKDLLDFLQTLVSRLETETHAQLMEYDSTKWIAFITTINTDFLAAFPGPNEFPWNAMHEKSKVSEVVFDVLYRVALRVGEVFLPNQGLVQDMLPRLLNIALSLDPWLDIPDVEMKEDFPSPRVLRDRALRAAGQILVSLGNNVKLTAPSGPGWKILVGIANECAAVCQDVLSASYENEFYIRLFSSPRITAALPEDIKKQPHIYVADASQVPLLLTCILKLLYDVNTPTLLTQCFMYSVITRMAEITRQCYDFLISPACQTTDSKRARSITRLIYSATSGLRPHPAFRSITDTMRLHVLISRLHDGPLDVWVECDKVLVDAMNEPFSEPPLKADIYSVLASLKEEQWEAKGVDLRRLATTFMNHSLTSLDEDTLEEIRAFAENHAVRPTYAGLAAAVGNALVVGRDIRVAGAETATVDRRTTIFDLVAKIINPDRLTWMDDGESLGDAHFVLRAFADVEKRFDRPVYNPCAKARLTLVENLRQLVCTCAHGVDQDCSNAEIGLPVKSVSACMRVLESALDGPGPEVAPAVRRAVYNALSKCIKHQRPGYNSRLDHPGQFAMRGLKDQDRTVRLRAGRCVAQFVYLYQGLEDSAQLMDPFFSSINTILAGDNEPFKETALISVGHIAKFDDPEIFLRCIMCFLSVLGQANPAITGTAYLQLQALCKHYGKPSYPLLSPYLDRIAPFLVGQVAKNPAALNETCNFLAISWRDFISITLPHTLPLLYISRDRRGLEIIAEKTEITVPMLFIQHAPTILAHIFMSPKPGQSTSAYNFIITMLSERIDKNIIIEIAGNPVAGFGVETITKLVMMMGDDDPGTLLAVKQALLKVNKYLNAKKQAMYDSVEEAVLEMLKDNMVGIVTKLNDLLQDHEGKTPVEAKRKILRALGGFIGEVGPPISNVAPQIMATLQTSLVIPELAGDSLYAWELFLRTLEPRDLASHVGPTSAAFIISWPSFPTQQRQTARGCLDYIVGQKDELQDSLDDIVDLQSAPELSATWKQLQHLRKDWTNERRLQKLLDRAASDNAAVISQALRELKSFLLQEDERFVRSLTSGDSFHPCVAQLVTVLCSAASRDPEESSNDIIRTLAFDCIGIMGAVDPDRFEYGSHDGGMIVTSNFEDEDESLAFVLHLIKDVLVDAFRTTCDITYQNMLAYAIQNLMLYCKFTPAVLTTGSSVPKKVRARWQSLPKHIMETITPLMAGKFTITEGPPESTGHPVYSSVPTYREWMQGWAAYLIERVQAPNAKTIFSKFHAVVRNKDVGVAHHILPHLVLNVLLSGDPTESERIRNEIRTVLEDQVAVDSASSPDKKELSAQVVFLLMDHLNKWVRHMRQSIALRKSNKRKRHETSAEADQLQLIDSVLTSIDQGLIANAALRCRAYARALMCFEQQLVAKSDINRGSASHQAAFERLHEIYAQLDEPDGMEGVSTLILAPSLEHQIREHENTGRWTSAQSCWEVKLQNSPDDLESHLGLLRCLRNLGHYDTLRTHVEGLLTRKPAWEPEVLGYQIESECMVGNWPVVEALVTRTKLESSPVTLARVLLAMRSRDPQVVSDTLVKARRLLGAPVMAAGPRGYRRAYEATLDLHILHEMGVIYNAGAHGDDHQLAVRFDELQDRLTSRLESTLPSFRFREPILSVRRTTFSLLRDGQNHFRANIGKSWLFSAKLARKAGYWQTAYSAILQGRQVAAPFYFIEDAKLLNATGEPLRALQELEKSLDLIPSVRRVMGENLGDVMDLTADDDENGKRIIAKAVKLRARWMNESDRYESQVIYRVFDAATKLWSGWESGHFHLGQFHDECSKKLDPKSKYTKQQTSRMNVETIKHFSKAIQCGSKYIYQTVPRVLTLWLDMGEDPDAITRDLDTANHEVSKLIKAAPFYKWYTAFPQIVSRVGHRNDKVYKILEKLICFVIREYPHQSLWLFASVYKSKYSTRSERGNKIFNILNSSSNNKRDINGLIAASKSMSDELLDLCNFPVDDKTTALSMSEKFPNLFELAPSPLIIPLRESLTASLPPTSSSTSKHQPFPVDLPTFKRFNDEIDIMRSLAKPRKITIYGSDGRTYMFLGKPKDDLRKDARLMDFNTIINKLLRSNSESRRRKLYIRTYGIVTLNEECGFIQWVPNTIPVRPVLVNLYQAKGLPMWGPHTKALYDKVIACRTLQEAGKTFRREILSVYPPVFHEWFVETFPEPSAWHASRLAFTRTAAVMSMVGFILGLGDRHCENILLDTQSGDAIHVDFNCLFEKGKNLETPERVPFRLTQNIVDGFGVTGVEGVFRTACEITFQLLRENRDCLMTVLDAFVHDPLVEWEEEHKKKSARARREQNQVKVDVDLRMLARNALQPIGRKLRGIHTVGLERAQKELTTSSLVQTLILEATDDGNLGKMYPGWSPHS